MTQDASKKSEKKKSEIETAGEDLFNFAVDREDLKMLMAHLPETADIKRATVEYELQTLKIISVGWGISYCLENSPRKNQLTELYWTAVYEFSKNLSETTELMTGHAIDYFKTLKDRLDMYLDALNKKPDAPEAVVVIGPEFAEVCGNMDDVFTVMTGSKMFTLTIGGVKEYLEAIKLR
ncbi:MAG: hypothetical protein JRI75_05710 [Deltaproteobacteria bacterium]|nr:hypothetical protein [Deltaproteobacteria bacterium]